MRRTGNYQRFGRKVDTVWGDITGTLSNQVDLQTALDGKSATSHSHTKADVGLGSVDNTSDAAKPVSTATQAGLDGKAPTSHTHAEGDITGLVSDLAAKEVAANKNAASGYAGLSAASKLTGSQQTYGTAVDTACQGNDTRLSDARVPTTHAATHVTGGSDVIASAVAAGNAGLMTGADKTKLDGVAVGAEVNVNADWNAVSGDAQILNKPSTFAPAAHAASHKSGGSDVVLLDELGAPTDVTILNASTTAHGLLRKLTGSVLNFLRADGNFTSVYQQVADEGTVLAQQPTINFIGAGVSVADNPGASRTDVTIPGGGGGGISLGLALASARGCNFQ